MVFSAPSGKGGHVIAVTDQVGRVFEAHVDIVRRLRYFEAEGEPQAGDSAAAPASQLVSDAVESQVVVRVPKAAVKDATYLPANPLDAAVPGAAAVSVQWRQLCLGYHRVMCAALLLDGPLAHVAATQGRRCVVLGLGGGALPLLLHRATQMEVVAVEWDADVVSIAQTLFGVPVHGGVASGAGGGVAAGAGAAVASGHERAPDVDGGATPSPSRLLVVVQEAAAYVKVRLVPCTHTHTHAHQHTLAVCHVHVSVPTHPVHCAERCTVSVCRLAVCRHRRRGRQRPARTRF